MLIQSIVFKKKHWTLKKAKAFLKKNGYKTDVDIKEDTYRFRQAIPYKKMRYFTQKGNRKGLLYIMMY